MGRARGLGGSFQYKFYSATLALSNESSYYISMSADLQALEDAARDFERDADLDFVDPRRLSAVIDRQPGQKAGRSPSCRPKCVLVGGQSVPDVEDDGGRSPLRRRPAEQPAQ